MTVREVDELVEKLVGVGTRKHKHCCDECKTVWEHADECGYENFEAAHTCPSCGATGQTYKYYGNKELDYISPECGSFHPVTDFPGER